MNPFVSKLEKCGYFQFFLFFGNANLRVADWELAAVSLESPLKEFVELFLLQKPIPWDRAEEIIGAEQLEEFVALEIVLRDGDQAKSNDFCLLVAFGHAYFAQLSTNPFAYFGEDSLALASYQSRLPNANVLDLCAGPGIQSLVASAHAREVVAVERNKKAAKVAEFNLRMNERSANTRVVNSALEEFPRGEEEKFDQILFNPPLVPIPGDLKYHAAGHGGIVGLDVVRTIFDLYRSTLNDGGRLDFIGMTMKSTSKPSSEEPLRALIREFGFGGRMHVLSRHHINRNSLVLDMLVSTLAQENEISPASAMDQLLDFYQTLGHDECYLYFCSVTPAEGTSPPLQVIDMSASHYGGWFC